MSYRHFDRKCAFDLQKSTSSILFSLSRTHHIHGKNRKLFKTTNEAAREYRSSLRKHADWNRQDQLHEKLRKFIFRRTNRLFISLSRLHSRVPVASPSLLLFFSFRKWNFHSRLLLLLVQSLRESAAEISVRKMKRIQRIHKTNPKHISIQRVSVKSNEQSPETNEERSGQRKNFRNNLLLIMKFRPKEKCTKRNEAKTETAWYIIWFCLFSLSLDGHLSKKSFIVNLWLKLKIIIDAQT